MTVLRNLGGRSSVATDIAQGGDVVGYSTTAAGQPRAVLWRTDGSLVDLGTLGGTISVALAIAADGSVVGYSTTPSGRARAFRWTADGGMLDLGTGADDDGVAFGLNRRGEIAGHLTVPGEPRGRRAALWSLDGRVRAGRAGEAGTSTLGYSAYQSGMSSEAQPDGPTPIPLPDLTIASLTDPEQALTDTRVAPSEPSGP
jgi:probable HAF family extracellular repeat protein